MQTVSLADACVLLNVSPPLTETKVRQRFRDMAKAFHPDVSPASRQDFRHLLLAYQTLLTHCATQQSIAKPALKTVTPLPVTEMTLVLSAEQAEKGGKQTLNVTWSEPCHRCRNHSSNKPGCKQCSGSGQKPMHRKVTVKLPPHIEPDSQLRLAKQGIPHQGRSADLLVTIKVSAPPTTPSNMPEKILTLTVWEALLGGEKTVQTPEGPVKWVFPSGIQPDTVICFKNKGIAKGEPWTATVKVCMPEKLSRECLALIKQCQDKTVEKQR